MPGLLSTAWGNPYSAIFCESAFGPCRSPTEGHGMTKTLTALAAAAVVALASTAAARFYGFAVGAGVIGGIAAGAIIGGATANSAPPPVYAYPGYAPVAGYEPYGYAGAVPVGCPGGYWARRPLVDAYGRVVGYSRPRFFCP